MRLVEEARGVRWEAAMSSMTENEIILCQMLEDMMTREIAIKGNLLMYVRSGPIYRQLTKLLVKTYSSYHTV